MATMKTMQELKLIIYLPFNGNSIEWKNFEFFSFQPFHANELIVALPLENKVDLMVMKISLAL